MNRLSLKREAKLKAEYAASKARDAQLIERFRSLPQMPVPMSPTTVAEAQVSWDKWNADCATFMAGLDEGQHELIRSMRRRVDWKVNGMGQGIVQNTTTVEGLHG